MVDSPGDGVPVGEGSLVGVDAHVLVPDGRGVVEKAIGLEFGGLGAHEESRLDGVVLDEPVGVGIMRAAADVPPDVLAGLAGMLGLGDVEFGCEGAPGVDGLDDGVGAEAVVVGGGHEQDFGEGLSEGLCAALEDGELVLASLVEAVDVGVVEESELLGLEVGGTEAVDGLLHLLLEALLLDAAVEDVAEVEGDEASLPMESGDDVPVGCALPVEVVEVDLVVGEEVGVDELHLVEGLGLGHLAFGESAGDGGGQRRVVGHAEGADADMQPQRHGRRAGRRHGDLASVHAGPLVSGRMEAQPEALQVATADGHPSHAAQNGVGPPAHMGDLVRRSLLGPHIADRVRLGAGQPLAALVHRRLQRHLHLLQVGAGNWRHDQLAALPLMPGQRQLDVTQHLGLEVRVARQHLLHGAGDADEHPVGGQATRQHVALEPQQRRQTPQALRQVVDVLADDGHLRHGESVRVQLPRRLVEASQQLLARPRCGLTQRGHVGERVQPRQLLVGDPPCLGEGLAPQLTGIGEQLTRVFRARLVGLQQGDADETEIHVRVRTLREEVHDADVGAVDGGRKRVQLEDIALEAVSGHADAVAVGLPEGYLRVGDEHRQPSQLGPDVDDIQRDAVIGAPVAHQRRRLAGRPLRHALLPPGRREPQRLSLRLPGVERRVQRLQPGRGHLPAADVLRLLKGEGALGRLDANPHTSA